MQRTPAAVHAAQGADSHLRDVYSFCSVAFECGHTTCHRMWRKVHGVGGVGLLDDDDDMPMRQ